MYQEKFKDRGKVPQVIMYQAKEKFKDRGKVPQVTKVMDLPNGPTEKSCGQV